MIPYNGFTLIELIVVIAILAILALIAIPRFAGFTDKAKIQADDQYASLVGNAAMVLLAAGDIKFTATGNATVTVDETGIVIAHTNLSSGTKTIGDGSTLALSDALNDLIAALVAPKPLQHWPNQIIITLTADSVTTKVGS